MAYAGQNQSRSSRSHADTFSADAATFDVIDAIKQLAEVGVDDKKYVTYDELLFRLRRWWSQYYQRPYKDPLLDSYTLEELLFEYYDVDASRRKRERDEQEAKEVPQEEHDWAAEEERRELEAEEEAAAIAAAEAMGGESSDLEDDTIVEENVESGSDAAWADKYAPAATSKTLINPSADQVDEEGGDINATFGS